MKRIILIGILIIKLNLVCLSNYNIELGQIIFLPEKGVTRVVVGNSEVVSATPVSDGVVITTKNVGTSDVMIFTGNTKKVETILVRVPKNDKQKALTIIENLGLEIVWTEESCVLRGVLPDEKTLSYVEGLASILETEVILDIKIDQDSSLNELEELLRRLNLKLNIISQTAIITGIVPSKELHDGVVMLVRSFYPEAVSLMEIKKDESLRDLPDLGYKGVTVIDYGDVAILEGTVENEKIAEALISIVGSYREKAVSVLDIQPKKARLEQSLFKDLGQLKLEYTGDRVLLLGEADSLTSYKLAKELFNSLYPTGSMKVKISVGHEVLREWATILNCELIEAGEIYAVRGTPKNFEVLLEIGKLYEINIFPVVEEANGLEFLKTLFALEGVELNLFKDSLYVRGLPKEISKDFHKVAEILFGKVVYLDESTNPKEPYTVQVSGFQITEKDLDQLSLETAKLMQGWQEVVLNWQELGVIRDIARDWEIKQPSIMVYPGEKTAMHTGGEIPIPYEQGVEWREFGVNLECQFGLLEDGLIPGFLNIVVSDLDWGNGVSIRGTSLPALTRYSYEGNVQLPKGGGVLLLRHWSKKEGWIDRSLPYLRGLPVFGSLLFGKRQRVSHSQIMCVLVEVK